MMYRAAALYCNGENGRRLTKTEIANRLQSSPTQVARWLEAAEEQNIIKLEFAPPRLRHLEAALIKRFGLREAVVVSAAAGLEEARRLRGQALAEYFDQLVEAGKTVGVSGGSSLWEMALRLRQKVRPRIRLVPAAIIGRGPRILHIDPTVILSVIWAKSGGRPTDVDAPEAYSTTVFPFRDAGDEHTGLKNLRSSFREVEGNERVQEVVAIMKQVDVLFLSCGPAKASAEYTKVSHHSTARLLESAHIFPQWLEAHGAVGDLAYSFINAQGHLVPECNFFLTIATVLGTDGLRNLAATANKHVILTCGQYADEVLKAALTGGLCNVLVCEDVTAQALVD